MLRRLTGQPESVMLRSMTNALVLTADLTAELDDLTAKYGATLTIVSDRNVPGLAYRGTVNGREESGPVGPELASPDEAAELLAEVERAGYPVAR